MGRDEGDDGKDLTHSPGIRPLSLPEQNSELALDQNLDGQISSNPFFFRAHVFYVS